MDKAIWLVLSALLGGAAGGGLVHMLGSNGPGEARVDEAGQLVMNDATVDALWSKLQDRMRADQDGNGTTLQTPKRNEMLLAAPELTDRQIAALAAKMKEQVADETKKLVAEQVKDAMEKAEENAGPRRPARPRRVRKSLADAAAELQLTSSEEAALREHYESMANKGLELLAGDGQTADDIRRELEDARDDPAKRMQLMPKYLPRIMPKMGEFMALQGQMRTGVEDAVGKEKAAKIRSGYTIEESDPYKMRPGGGGFRGFGR